VGFLRSVAVAPEVRDRGVGRALVIDRVALAHAMRLNAVYLLTTTAADYFRTFGFSSASRDDVPPELSASPEFSGACPSSATCLRLRLRE
jgi:amino-acid N-acetyltransferase